MRSFEESMRRSRLLAQGINPDTEKPVINTYNSNSNLENRGLDPGNNNTDKSNRNYKGLYYLIHTDPTLLLAQSWEMEPGLLYNLCRDYGITYVKSVIQKVNKIGPRYFREGEPVEPQRGRYCHAIVLKEGRKI